MSSCRLQEVKNDRKSLNFQAQKVVGVAYRRWSFTRGSNCKALTKKVLVFWISGRLYYGRWSPTRGGRTSRFDCIRVFFGGKTKSPCFDLFIYWLTKQIKNTYETTFQGHTEIALIIKVVPSERNT